VTLGLALRGLATAAIDVSDGLLADLGHVLEASNVAATLQPAVLPAPTFDRNCYLAGGDDYELVFTAPSERHAEVAALAATLALPLTCIGRIETGTGLTVLDPAGQPLDIARRGYDHFS
jgi:thiamine-monophosphate kinase